MPGIQIGQLLIEQDVLSAKQVDHILSVQRVSHRPFGDLAERLYGISPQAVEDAWVQQYMRIAGTIDLDDQKFDEQGTLAVGCGSKAYSGIGRPDKAMAQSRLSANGFLPARTHSRMGVPGISKVSRIELVK